MKIKILAITAVIFLAAVGLAFASGGGKNFDMRMMGENSGMSGMMMGNMMGGSDKMQGMMDGNSDMNEMHKMMHGSENEMGAGCMGMMENMESMSLEEKEKMLADMDKDNDGKCDMCGMSIEMCRSMMGL